MGPLVSVAAVQWARQPFRNVAALASALEAPLAVAARSGAALVVFSGGVSSALALALGCPAGEPALPQEFEALGRRLAAAQGVTLALGALLVGAQPGARRAAFLFGPTGDVLGAQAQTHRSLADRAAGLAVATGLAPVQTPAGPVGLVVGADVAYPEVSRILCLQGAKILVHQDALPQWSEAQALSRLWREVQANQVFGVEAYSVGQGCRGRSAIHAPVEMTPGGTGWLARAADDQHEAVVTATLDFASLARVIEGYPIGALGNEAQYRRYFPAVYEAWLRRQEGADERV